MKDFLEGTGLLGFAEVSTLNFSIYGQISVGYLAFKVLSIDITQYGYCCSPTFGEHCDRTPMSRLCFLT